MYRLFSVGVVLLWMSAMAALFARDVWPSLTAQDPPPMTREQLAGFQDLDEQYSIRNGDGRRIGTAWNSVRSTGAHLRLAGTIVIEGFGLIPPVRIETVTEFDAEGGLDSFELNVHGVPMTKIKVHGERRGIYFPCELQVGPLNRQANLDLSASRMIGQSLRPFTFLPTLHVGQSWRMQILDPLSAVLRRSTEFNAVVARVTHKETIEVQGADVECFVVETSPHQSRAWVDHTGRVLKQKAEMAGLGVVIMQLESYDERERADARKRIKTYFPKRKER